MLPLFPLRSMQGLPISSLNHLVSCVLAHTLHLQFIFLLAKAPFSAHQTIKVEHTFSHCASWRELSILVWCWRAPTRYVGQRSLVLHLSPAFRNDHVSTQFTVTKITSKYAWYTLLINISIALFVLLSFPRQQKNYLIRFCLFVFRNLKETQWSHFIKCHVVSALAHSDLSPGLGRTGPPPAMLVCK